jgi:hypothetical protein
VARRLGGSVIVWLVSYTQHRKQFTNGAKQWRCLPLNPRRIYCYVNLRLIKQKIQDENDQIAARTRVDPDNGWEDFFEAAFLDNIEDKRERVEVEEEEENGSASSSDDY